MEVQIGKTVDEIMAMKFPTKYKWGKWSFKNNLTIVHADADWYEVDLERMSTREMLDWIIQLRNKVWIKPKDLGDMIYALEDIFGVQAQLNQKGAREQYDIKRKYIKRSQSHG